MQLLRPMRLTRPETPPPFRLQPRDEAIVRFVADHRFANSEQIYRFLCIFDPTTSRQRLSRRLAALFSHRFLQRPRNQHIQLGALAHLVYTVGPEGLRLLAESGTPVDQRALWSAKASRLASAPYLNHALAVTEIMLHFHRACAARDGVRLMDQPELLTLLPAETQAKHHPLRLRVTVKDNFKPLPLSVVPDRAFALHYADDTRHNLLLEADQGTMTIAARRLTASSIGKKIRVYLTAFDDQRHRSQWGFAGFRVATVTPSEARLQAILEAQRTITNNKMSGMFLYTTPQRLNELGAFGPVWTTANDERVSLIKDA